MDRRMSARAQVDVPAFAIGRGLRHACRAVDLSTTGMVVEQPRELASREAPELGAFELHLAGGQRVRARTRRVWSEGRVLAVRFVVIGDVDRLAIAEHVDDLARRGARLH